FIFLLTFYLKKSIINNVETRRNTQVWLKGSVLKTERGVKACGGSNPSSSSIHITQLYKGSVAQSVEQRTENPCVGGSIPSRAIFLHLLKQAAGLFFIFIPC